MTSIYLITGFLGSGKTTFLKKRLEDTDGNVGVLVNEFGKINIDSKTIGEDDLKIVELTNGSIFCSCLKENFIDSLAYLINLNLKEIFIESSGLSDPSEMTKVLNILEKMNIENSYRFIGTICVVDGVYFKAELKKMVSVERQVKHSHYIVINKTDLVDKKNIEEILTIIKEINPKAGIGFCSYGDINWANMNLEYFNIKDEKTTNRIENRPLNIIIKFKIEPKIEQIQKLLEEISGYFYRIKGIIKIDNLWYKVDVVNESISVVQFNKSFNCENKKEFNQLVCLSSQGLQSVSNAAQIIEKNFTPLCRLEI